MRVILKALLVSLAIYLVGITGINLLSRLMPAIRGPVSSFVAYVTRIVILFLGVRLFYSRSVFSFAHLTEITRVTGIGLAATFLTVFLNLSSNRFVSSALGSESVTVQTESAS